MPVTDNVYSIWVGVRLNVYMFRKIEKEFDMNIRRLVQLGLVMLIVMSLSFATTTSAAAGGGGDDEETPNDYVGQVSTTTSDAIPHLTKGKPGIQPNAVNPVPGGGYATAQATLAWAAARMDGIAKTSLSSGVTGTFSLCATATQVYKNSVPKGGAGQVCGARTGGGSVQSKKSVYEYVFGYTWRLDTNHAVTASGYSWYPSLTVYANP